MSLLGRIEAALAVRLAAAPDVVVDRILGAPVVVDGRTLDRRLQWVAWLDRATRRAALESQPVAQARRSYRRMRLLERGAPVIDDIRDHALALGDRRVAVRVYRPAAAVGTMVYLHGGGGVVGDLDTHDALCRQLADAGGFAVASVAYRLAPEHPFPAAFDDAFAAYVAIADGAAELGLDPTRMAVGGDSFGGTLAAATCHRLRAARRSQPRVQMLLYPPTDARGGYGSRTSCAEGFWLTESLIRWFEHHAVAGVDLDDPRRSPLRERDLSGLAPAIVAVAGFDPLRDEGIAYAAALARAGGEVELREASGLVHGHAQMTGAIAAARRELRTIAASVGARLAVEPTG